MIAIEAIRFNHDTNVAHADGLNLRKNVTDFIHTPEWRRFVSVNPEDSRAAYAIAPTKHKTITIEVSLSSADPGAAFAEVRVKNHVKARPINFINGKTGFLTFELLDPPVSHGRVGLWDLEWRWEYRQTPHHPWHHFVRVRRTHLEARG